MTGAYCVDHREEFWAGDAASGAYLLFLTLSDPDGYRMHAGGPASAFVTPAARDHGTPPAFEREKPGGETPAGIVNAAGALSGKGLPPRIKNCIRVGEPDAFCDSVTADLEKLYATPTGKKMLESLASSGKKVDIVYSMGGNSMLSYDAPAARFVQADGSTGAGTNSEVV